MSAPNIPTKKPEESSANPQLSQDKPGDSSQVQSPTPETSTSQQVGQPTSPFSTLTQQEKDKMLADSAIVIRKQNTELAKLKEDVEAIKRATQKQAEPTKEQQTAEFYNNPRDIIKAEMAEQVKPLNDFIRNFESTQNIESTKVRLKSDPAIAPYLSNPTFSSMVDDAFNAGVAKTPENYEAVVLGMIGAAATGRLKIPSQEQTQQNQQTQQQDVTPPHLKPSAPPQNLGPEKPKEQIRQLTEAEARVAKIWGMTPEEYIRDTDMRDEDVINPIEKKKEGN